MFKVMNAIVGKIHILKAGKSGTLEIKTIRGESTATDERDLDRHLPDQQEMMVHLNITQDTSSIPVFV